MLNLMEPTAWTYYGGNWVPETYDGQPVYRNPGDDTYTRVVTRQNFQSPRTFRGWFVWMGSKYDVNPAYAGIHFHVGHQDNHHNYALSLRLDGTAVIQQEYEGNYTRLTDPTTFRLKGWTRYQFECVWGPQLELKINGQTVSKEDPGAHWKYPRIETGQVGFRLDKQDVRLGSLTVRA